MHAIYKKDARGAVKRASSSFINLTTAFILAVTGLGGSLPLILASNAHAAGTSTIVNTDFNTYDGTDADAPANWTFNNVAKATNQCEDGNSCAQLPNDTSLASSATVNLPLAAGQTPASLSFYFSEFMSSASGTYGTLTVSQKDSSGNLLGSANYQDDESGASKTLTLDSQTQKIVFSFSGDAAGGADAAIDDVVVTANNATGPAPGDVVVNEVSPLGTEWVELYNTTGSPIDMSGWRIIDSVGTTNFGGIFPAGASIPSGGFFVQPESSSAIFNDSSSDSVILEDASGNVINQMTYGGAGTDEASYPASDQQTISRTTDGGASWDVQNATKHATNVITPTVTNGDFAVCTMAGSCGYDGIDVGFNVNDFKTITSAKVTLSKNGTDLVTNSALQPMLDYYNNGTGTVLSTPFVITPGSFNPASDTYWTHGAYNWTQADQPDAATVTVTGTDASGTTVTKTVTNTNFVQGQATFASLIPTPAPAATNLTANPNNGQGWIGFDDTGSGGSSSYVSGPGTPPLGTGSLELKPSSPSNGYAVYNSVLSNTLLSNVRDLSYNTYRSSGSNPAQAVSLQLNIDPDATDGNTGWQGRLVYEPYLSGTTVDSNSWQAWNAMSGKGWYFSHAQANGKCSAATYADTCSWQEVLQYFPNAEITSGVNLKVGSGWASDYIGEVDNVQLASTTVNNIYNFEPAAPADTTAPQVTFTSPTNGNAVNTTDVSGTITDDTNVSQYSFHVTGPNGVSWNTGKFTPNQKSVNFSLNLCANDRLHACNETTLPQGNYHVQTIAYDGVGNDSRSEPGLDFVLDTINPTVTFVTADNHVQQGLKVDVDFTDPHLSQISFEVRGPNGFSFNTSKMYVSGDTSLRDYDLCSSDRLHNCQTSNLQDGTYTIRALAYDSAGNRNISTSSHVVVDRSAPNGSFDVPSGYVSGTQTIKVNLTAVGAAGLGEQQVVMRDSNGTVAQNWQYNVKTGASRVVTGNGSFSYSGDERSGTLSITFDSAGLNGTYNLRLFTHDQLGNGRSNIYGQLKLDNTNPSVSFTSPASGATVHNLNISATLAGTGSNLIEYGFDVSGPNGIHFSTANYQVNQPSVTLTDFDLCANAHYGSCPSNLPDGTYTVRAKTYDAAGNRNISTYLTFTVDNSGSTNPGGGNGSGSGTGTGSGTGNGSTTGQNNSNTVTFKNNNPQTAKSGSVTSGGNTGGLGAASGNASNTSFNTFAAVLGASTNQPSSSNQDNNSDGQVKGDSTTKLATPAASTTSDSGFNYNWLWLLLLLLVIPGYYYTRNRADKN